MLSFQAAVAFGAVVWGAVAVSLGIRASIATAGMTMVATALLPVFARWLRLAAAVDADVATGRWPNPHVTVEPDPDDGPVLVMVAYQVNEEDADAFLQAMRKLRTVRRRDGALRWRIYRDLRDPSTYVETYVCESWGEHLRQRSRSTPADRQTWLTARSLHSGEDPPVASFHVAARAGQSLHPVVVDDDLLVAGSTETLSAGDA
jgi:quinol monooxygenase YgiN